MWLTKKIQKNKAHNYDPQKCDSITWCKKVFTKNETQKIHKNETHKNDPQFETDTNDPQKWDSQKLFTKKWLTKNETQKWESKNPQKWD